MATASADAPAGRDLIDRLLTPAAYPHPVGPIRLIETHISWVFLTGEYVYKLKKPVDLGFLDFTSLEKRRHYCAEEVRLNRRFAPRLYLDVVPISGPSSAARVDGGGEPVEWAVRLRQFDDTDRLDRLLERGGLSATACGQLAVEIARLQEGLEVADEGTPWGTAEAVAAAIDTTLDRLRRHRPDLGDRVAGLARRLHAMLSARAAAFAARREGGRVRQCHGDLHLANLVRIDGRFVAFDAIEFSDTLRWIDVASDVAFLAMDLAARGRPDLAATFTSGWIEAADDHHATTVLPVYACYRAAVRAAVAAIRSAQAVAGLPIDPAAARSAAAEADRYLTLAETLAADRRPVLVATSGVSGSGKTTLAGGLAARLGAVRLRSDVERKRLAGMAATDRPGDAAATAALYSEATSRRTYERLARLAGLMLAAGTPVVVDAACNRRGERRLLAEAARAASVPLVWLSLDVPADVAVARVTTRLASGADASDASAEVVRGQLLSRDPILPDELAPSGGGGARESLVRVAGADVADPAAVARLAARIEGCVVRQPAGSGGSSW